MRERTKLALLLLLFAAVFFLPIEAPRTQRAFLEGLFLLKEYARQHVLLCLVPAFFIAGAIARLVRQDAVLRYLGASANRAVAYGTAAISGSLLAVCSCTVLPLFAGIYHRGAGLGPAVAFLYAGPAINVLALILTARVLGPRLGLARAAAAVLFSVVVGLLMAAIFRREVSARNAGGPDAFAGGRTPGPTHGPPREGLVLAALVGILVLANWGAPGGTAGSFAAVHRIRWPLIGVLLVSLGWMLVRWFRRAELTDWVDAAWGFAKQIVPLLFAGIVVSGWILGRPGTDAGILPSSWVAVLVGGNSLRANLVASIAGALMYIATLTEVPIVQTLLGAGMGQGPALALLLAGPSLSLPSMLVMGSYLGFRRTVVYVGLVIVMAAAAGWLFGLLAG